MTTDLIFNTLLYIIGQRYKQNFCNLQLSVLWRILISASHVIPVNRQKIRLTFENLKPGFVTIWPPPCWFINILYTAETRQTLYQHKCKRLLHCLCTYCPTGYHRCLVVKNILLSSSIVGPCFSFSTSLFRCAFNTWSWVSARFVRGSCRSIGCKQCTEVNMFLLT